MAKEGLSLKPLRFIASARDDLRAMPPDVKDQAGFALERVQAGKAPSNSKQLRGSLRDVHEIVIDDNGNTYRTIYTTTIGGVVYVLDVFQKKSKRGLATPQKDLARIQKRLIFAREHHEKST